MLNGETNEGERIGSYLVELHYLAIPCNYNQLTLNTLLKDVSVTDLQDRAIRDSVFE